MWCIWLLNIVFYQMQFAEILINFILINGFNFLFPIVIYFSLFCDFSAEKRKGIYKQNFMPHF